MNADCALAQIVRQKKMFSLKQKIRFYANYLEKVILLFYDKTYFLKADGSMQICCRYYQMKLQ